MQSVMELLDKNRIRKEEFDKVCPDYKIVNDKTREEIVNAMLINGDDAPCTPYSTYYHTPGGGFV
jgi:hypothetical protein